MSHTPTPWRVDIIDRLEIRADAVGPLSIAVMAGGIAGGSSGSFEVSHDDCKANAAFIVKAVNSHYALVKALRELESFASIMFSRDRDGTMPDTVPTPLGPHVKIGAIMANARAALALTEDK